jgi:hypothetical protein
MKVICRLLVVSLLFFSYHSTAGMIGTEKIASAVSAQAERMQIQSTLSRADVASALQSMGVDVKTAQERVAALTDEEARSLAGKLGSVPAGADSGGWWIAVIVVAVLLLVWWRWR